MRRQNRAQNIRCLATGSTLTADSWMYWYLKLFLLETMTASAFQDSSAASPSQKKNSRLNKLQRRKNKKRIPYRTNLALVGTCPPITDCWSLPPTSMSLSQTGEDLIRKISVQEMQQSDLVVFSRLAPVLNPCTQFKMLFCTSSLWLGLAPTTALLFRLHGVPTSKVRESGSRFLYPRLSSGKASKSLATPSLEVTSLTSESNKLKETAKMRNSKRERLSSKNCPLLVLRLQLLL